MPAKTEPGDDRPLRRDAAANRERVLAAAARTVRRDGEVSMATIAAEAGVGVGTLYRRFPTREALLAALSHRAFELVLEQAQRALDQPGQGVDALDHFLEATIAHRDRLVLPLHGGPGALPQRTVALQGRVREVLAAVLARGRRDGSIADGLTAADVIVLGAMLAQGLPGAHDWERSARRQKQLFLAGVRPRGGGS